MSITKKSTRDNADGDEELARALQEQFRNEVKQVASSSAWSQIQNVFSSGDHGARGTSGTVSNGSGNTARSNSSSSSRSRPPPSAPARSNSNSSGTSRSSSRIDYRTPKHKYDNTDSNVTAETLATTASSRSSIDRHEGRLPLPRKLSYEIEQEQKKQHSRGSPRTSPRSSPRTSPTRGSPRNSPKSSRRASPRSSSRFLGGMFVDTSEDEAVARKLNQELRDAELAARLEQADRVQRTSANFAVDDIPVRNVVALPSSGDDFVETHTRAERGARRQKSASSPQNDFRGKAMSYGLRAILTIFLMGVCFLIYITVFGKETVDSLDPSAWLPGFPDEDPMLGSVGDHNVWKSDGAGLRLQIINNLDADSDWNEHMESSISEWNNGEPDAVTLNIRTMAADPECRAVRQAMKVCNANYGPTDWRGVNQILLQDDYIITSLAKMNDYYLEGTNKAQKQYTMCHELGHGLGLGHSDENFHNVDLGNCMDYTERPQNNMHPDESNFNTLEELYGNVNNIVKDNAKENVKDNVKVERMKAPGNRLLSDEADQLIELEFEEYAAYLMDPIFVASEHTDTRIGWRLLRKTESAELHERHLGNGYSIRTSILLA